MNAVLRPPVDLHVHLAGTGRTGSGCYMNPKRYRSLAFRLIRRSLKLSDEESERLEQAVAERLLDWLDDAAGLHAVVLALDWARDARGEPVEELTDLFVPNEVVLRLASAHPRLRAGVSVHPFRKDAVEELARCAQAGAALVKWLPVSQNFSPADDRCAPFYDALADLRLPLLCHTGSEGATRNIDKRWNDPRVLVPALDRGVTVIAAHAGMRSLPHDRDHFATWQAMLKDYPHLYGDTASVFGLRARKLARALDREHVVDRLAHGSDWPVPSSPWWFLGALKLGTIRRLRRIRNPLVRDLETKRSLGLPDAVFTRAWDLLRADNRGR